jgi:hypothetical protein
MVIRVEAMIVAAGDSDIRIFFVTQCLSGSEPFGVCFGAAVWLPIWLRNISDIHFGVFISGLFCHAQQNSQIMRQPWICCCGS